MAHAAGLNDVLEVRLDDMPIHHSDTPSLHYPRFRKPATWQKQRRFAVRHQVLITDLGDCLPPNPQNNREPLIYHLLPIFSLLLILLDRNKFSRQDSGDAQANNLLIFLESETHRVTS